MKDRLKIGIFFMGKYTNAIGPPKSMVDLADLLSKDFDVERGGNLKPVEQGKNKPQAKNDNGMSLITKIKLKVKGISVFYNAVMFLYILKFNVDVFRFAFKYPNAKIIITQSCLIYTFYFPNIDRVFYIRRGNSILSKLSGSANTTFIKKIANNSFVKYKNMKMVYLVDNGDLPYDYAIIPNFFDMNMFDLKYSQRYNISLSYIGTWCERKGASLYINLVDAIKGVNNFEANVFGVLGNDKILNDKLLSNRYIDYKGLVPKPSSYMYVGDIFISFSALEGLQRSLIESMLTGCIVIGLERPDTMSISNCPGVFVFKDDSDLMANVISVLDVISNMEIKERQALGLSCREYASIHFSKEKILSSWKNLLNA